MADQIDVGETVLAKWSGSRKFLKGKVLNITSTEVHVEFEDGTKDQVKASDVKKIVAPVTPPKPASPPKPRSRSRSPARGKTSKSSSSPAKSRRSPTRGRSPSGSPARKKSPARTPKAKVVKNTDKAVASTSGEAKPKRGRPSKADVGSDSDSFSPKPSPSRARTKSKTTSSPVRKTSRSRKSVDYSEIEVIEKKNKAELAMASGSRTPRFPEVSLMDIFPKGDSVPKEKVYSTRLRSSVITNQITVTDKVDGMKVSVASSSTKEEEVIFLPQKLPKVSFLGSLPSLFILFAVPILSLFLILACVRNGGSLWSLVRVPTIWKAYISPIPIAIVFGFALFQAILMFIPIGSLQEGFVDTNGHKKYLKYRLNGLASFLISLNIVPLGIFYLDLPRDYITQHYLHLACAAFLLAITISVFVYVKSFYAKRNELNEGGTSGWIYHDFVKGREVNPRIGKSFDLKMYVIRTGATAWAIVDLLMLYKCYSVHGSIHYPLIATSAMQLMFLVDLFYKEEVLLSTATFMYEGFGYHLITAFITSGPFFATIPVLYLLNQKIILSSYCLAGMAVLFLVGFVLSRKSLMDKHLVKRNPHLALKSLKTIPYGRNNLVVSGCWSLVRHPNYLGDLLMEVAWTLPCGFAAGAPYVPLIVSLFVLLSRVYVVEKQMERKYGVAWHDYKQRVPKRLVPYVF